MNKKILVVGLLSTLLLASCWVSNTPTDDTQKQLTGGWSTMPTSTTLPLTDEKVEKITVTVLTDSSYFTWTTSIDSLITRMKGETFLKDATFVVLDYNKDTDKEQVTKIMTDNKLSLLPAVLLNTKDLNDNGVMSDSLISIEGTSNYSLNIWSSYNPFTKEVSNPNVSYWEIKEDIMIDTTWLLSGKKEARYSLMTFSDFDCPYCKQSNSSNKLEELVTMMSQSDGNIIFKHFPLTDLHPKSNIKSLYAIKDTLKSWKLTKEILTKYFSEEKDLSLDWQDVSKEQKILDENLALGKTFGVQGTPTVVIYDNETRKFMVLPELMPTTDIETEFEKFITITNPELNPTVSSSNATVIPVDDKDIEKVMSELENSSDKE